MSVLYSKQFYEELLGIDYSDREYWSAFFKGIAKNIVEEFQPQTVLDAGCARGYLVEALRDLGVDAYGIDISEYAISVAREDIKEFLHVQSLIENLPAKFPERYDLVITIEVLEHMYAEDGKKAIEKLCACSDVIIFTSTPSDLNNKTHVNVQQREYWVELFARNSFYRDLVTRVDFICPHALLFKKGSDVAKVLFEYELSNRVNEIRMQEDKNNLLQMKKDMGHLFFDTGNGVSTDTVVSFEFTSSQKVSLQFEIPDECSAVRFDPIEGKGCIIENLTVKTNFGYLTYQNTNGITIGSLDIFLNTDPIVFITLPRYVTNLWIEYDICPIENMLLDKACYLLEKKVKEEHELLEKKADEFEQLEQENLKLNLQLNDLKNRYKGIVTMLDDVKKENENLESVLHDDKKKEDGLWNEYITLRNQLDEKEKFLFTLEASLREKEEKIERLKMKYEEKSIECLNLNLSHEQSVKFSAYMAEENRMELKKKDEELQKYAKELAYISESYRIVLEERDTNFKKYVEAINGYNAIGSSFFWRATKPFRKICDCGKKILNKMCVALRVVKRSLVCDGIRITIKKIFRKLFCIKKQDVFNEIVKFDLLTEQERNYQKNYTFEKKFKFSITVPLYNTPKRFLDDMIQSVQAQTYENWELCLADGSENGSETKRACREYMRNDRRIKYKKLSHNGGIGLNTIAAYDMVTGDYIVLLDHDDVLTENALFECAKCIEECPEADFIYSDKGVFEDSSRKVLAYHYLPDFSPEFLRACNYASHLNLFSKKLVDEIGFIREGYDGSQDYEFELRAMEKARAIKHIAKVLYYCRACEGSVALNPESKMYAYEAGRRAIEEHIERIGYPGKVEFLAKTFSYRIHYDIVNPGHVTIIIPNKDHVSDLRTCITSIVENTDYPDYSIVVVENNSVEKETFRYYKNIQKKKNIEVIRFQSRDGEFNFSAINNYAVTKTNSEYVLFLNNDIKVINSNWLTEMLMFAQREDVGAVGAKLYYPNETYQHIGLFVGLGGHIATHYDHRKSNVETGYMHRLSMPQNYNAVTGACLLVKREDFVQVGGFDEVLFKVGLNDVDLCLKLRELKKYNVVTPYAELYHYESVSRGSDEKGKNLERFEREQEAFRKKWAKYFENLDEYYNPGIQL